MKITLEHYGQTYSYECDDETILDRPLLAFLNLLVAQGFSKESIDQVLEFDYEDLWNAII